MDRLYGWSEAKDRPFIEAIEEQDDGVKREFESRASAILLSIAEQAQTQSLPISPHLSPSLPISPHISIAEQAQAPHRSS